MPCRYKKIQTSDYFNKHVVVHICIRQFSGLKICLCGLVTVSLSFSSRNHCFTFHCQICLHWNFLFSCWFTLKLAIATIFILVLAGDFFFPRAFLFFKARYSVQRPRQGGFPLSGKTQKVIKRHTQMYKDAYKCCHMFTLRQYSSCSMWFRVDSA